ncbi:MAG: quinol:electron acceptor oxidoreductase subunit ActD [Planctomycetota bacterium]|nr:quinol:electron acceptor oxidoreductase subunit ActD [Planctomycetota bacterium]MEC8511229.1 quinol:electron acceptor oxidoreductase subunit ActD [Planctomycetota bacterium]
MSDSNEKLHGIVAYFTDIDGLMAAARKVRDAGYKRWDSYTPFPVHGIDEAMGIKPTILPWIVLVMGLTGLSLGILLQWYTNAFDYVFLISGKPDWSLPANIPVAFEMVIAFSAFTTFLGMLALNKLPHLSNPLHKLESFRRITDDRFAIVVEAADKNFDAGRVRALLGAASAEQVEDCPVDTSRAALPLWFHGLAAIATCLTFIPLAVAFKGRFATSEKPRYHVWPDMDWQRKRKTQTEWEMFPDGRAMRLPVEGTIAQGELRDDFELYFGVDQDSFVPDRVSYDAGAMGPSAEGRPAWLTGFPTAMVVDEALLERGQQRYDIYCSVCHGQQGNGLGSVALRAKALDAQKWGWVDPKSLLADNAKSYSNGEIFHIVSQGVSTMKGYGAQIVPRDRWAIVAYVRALQMTQGINRRELNRLGVDPADLKPVPTIDDVRVSSADAGR